MRSPICEMFGIEFPLLAFSHCRDVVAAVSKAGGMGVFGAVNHPPDLLEEELAWIDEHVDGKPYGLDLIVPTSSVLQAGPVDKDALLGMLPGEHKQFANDVLEKADVSTSGIEDSRREHLHFTDNLTPDGAGAVLDVALSHPIKLLVNALGVPPQIMLDKGREHSVKVGALVGSAKHAAKQVDAGVDVLIAAGGEAGGHCGEVSTVVLVPEVVRAAQGTPVLAAGGIATGTQMAGMMAMGAAGAWCGSVWLTTSEAETSESVKEKMLTATSADTVRSRSRTGKPSRQLKSAWTEAWEAKGPKPLPMPLQTLISEPALRHLDKLADGGHQGAKELSTYWVGQAVGLMNEKETSGQVVQRFKEEFIEAYERLTEALGE
ncbi:nitronate monooxygenase [Parvularcula sp. ZS-1/3]|uniref:Nitronate monooxygenase n=1 Tax=Parvularcula mediterranea TaxID=2732508 RepID=A0A7Y3RLF8_9PROT|nr:nitronate monooxygenase family protein [Parvularcula mediterranea]NNU16174.1 nitronate monooxygenase [Parvularcula mediterranea]